MTTSLVLTVVGPDKPGLVNLLSETAISFGANWLESRMANLAGQFAGIVHLDVSEAQAGALIAALQALEAKGLHIAVATSRRDQAAAPWRLFSLELVAQDRPGIVREVSRVIAAHGVSIEQLDTDVFSAPHSGESMFRARAHLRAPAEMERELLRDALEDLANELMVDISLDDVVAGKSS
ncbi:ACT domain-containing protein [Rhodovastum sp. RN2-1]|uniref:ACT domain-containing protein n=2 Tax=Limobrevibacterium gyesilva TaxID=2991712 RepID=A0AA41YQN2_9PROT|nr:ACT domain-containing protein [Limobrevibacterium gyesilva]